MGIFFTKVLFSVPGRCKIPFPQRYLWETGVESIAIGTIMEQLITYEKKQNLRGGRCIKVASVSQRSV